MPQRLLTGSLNSHDRMEALTPEEEVCYYRLFTVVDDYGRFPVDPDLIVGHAFPRRRRELDDATLEQWLRGLAAKGVIRFYEVDGTRYLQMLVWDVTPRAKAPKYPGPPGSIQPKQFTPRETTTHAQPTAAAGMPTPGAGQSAVSGHADSAAGMPTPGAEQGAAPQTDDKVAGMQTPGAGQEPAGDVDWVDWYESKYPLRLTKADVALFDELKQGGMTDALIIEVIKEVTSEKGTGVRSPLRVVKSRLNDLVPYGVRTVEDRLKHLSGSRQRSPTIDDRSPDPPPEESDLAARIQEQNQALLRTAGGHG